MARPNRMSTYKQKTLYVNDERRELVLRGREMFPEESDSELFFRALQVRIEHKGTQDRVRALNEALQAATTILAAHNLLDTRLPTGETVGDLIRPLMQRKGENP